VSFLGGRAGYGGTSFQHEDTKISAEFLLRFFRPPKDKRSLLEQAQESYATRRTSAKTVSAPIIPPGEGSDWNRIPEAGIKTGDQFGRSKVSVRNGKKVISQLKLEVVAKNSEPAHDPEQWTDKPADDGFKNVMQRCILEAVLIAKEISTIPWQNEDV